MNHEPQLPTGGDRPTFIRRYVIAVLLAAAVGGLRLALVPVLGPTSPFITFYLAIVIAAAFGGMGPAVLITFAGVAVWSVILPPGTVASQVEVVRVGIFLLSGIGISLIGEALHRNRDKLQAVSRFAEENPNPVLRVGRHGSVQYANRPAAELLEKERRITQQALPSELKSAIEAALDTGAPREVQVRYAEGAIFSFFCSPVPRKGDVNVYGRNITELAAAEQELRRAKEANEKSLAQLEAVVGAMEEALVISDLDGAIQTMNPAALRLHGFTDIEQVRRHISEYTKVFEVTGLEGHPLPTDAWPLPRALQGETFRHQLIRVRRRDTGKEFIGSYSGTPVRDRDGTAILAILTIRDVTEQKRAEENLRAARTAADEANRAKSDFLAKMSHEIRTPMTVVIGSLDHVLETGATPEQRPLLEMAAAAANRLLTIINDVLDVAKIEARQVKIETRPFDLRECVGKAVDFFALAAREKGLHLHWQVAREVPSRTEGDPDRLTQVLVNLVGNAVKFTERGGVTVDVAMEADTMVFTVRDSGIGIRPDKLEAIFEPFNQGDESRTRHYGGTGLGLAIAKELIELMGGSIRAQSDEGRGSTFTLTLPLRASRAEMAGAGLQPTASAHSRTSRILLAEDEPVVRTLIETVLRRKGWEVAIAENGRRAVEKWQEGGIDIVLMDVSMPEMDGITAARQIRQRERGKEKKACIIALTAHSRPEDQAECLAAGMDGFLTKPMHVDELESAIIRCLH